VSLREYKGISKLKKEAMNILVKMMNEKEIEHLREQFMKIDLDNTGMINMEELE
jgi:calcium-dependent protein kinase